MGLSSKHPGNAIFVSERPLTYDDFLKLPDDGKRYEVIGGELSVHSTPRRDHQEVVASLNWTLQGFLRASGFGRAYTHPVDIWLGPNDIVEPDIVVIRESRLESYRPEGVVREPPDLVVEVLSPSTRGTDQVRKMALYAKSGVPEYWIADPDCRSLTIHVLEDGQYRPVQPDEDGKLASRVLEGLRVDPNEVFARLD
jgi:Uma2 family endonuclease